MARAFVGALLLIFLHGAFVGPLWSQTDVAVSGYGVFNGSTSANGTVESPSNQAGFLIEARHIRNPLIGYEATYSYNRANVGYSGSSNLPCPVGLPSPCGPAKIWSAVPANAHEITGDWVASLKLGAFRPFALAGVGVLFDVPAAGTATTTLEVCGTVNPLCGQTTGSAATSAQTRAVFVYGAGLDWSLIPHVGLRFQYRGNVYKATNLTSAFQSTDSFAHSAEPMAGAYFRF